MTSKSFKDDLIALIPRLRSYAIAMTGTTTEADDLVQEALLRAWRFRQAFQPGSNLKAWLFRILRNAFLAQCGRPRPLQDGDGEFSSQLASPPDQEVHLEYVQMLKRLGSLGAEQREALLLVAASGFSYEEAAEICNCATGTIKSRVSRAREYLSAEPSIPALPARAEKKAHRPKTGPSRVRLDTRTGWVALPKSAA
jgi:RNA polymerase sigma-70 factor (ECF subfamily)